VVRPGGSPLTITVTNANAAVADLVTTDGPASVAHRHDRRRRRTVADHRRRGRVAFDPRASGSTTVQVSAPGVVTVPTARRR
jgi:hypothetical protein